VACPKTGFSLIVLKPEEKHLTVGFGESLGGSGRKDKTLKRTPKSKNVRLFICDYSPEILRAQKAEHIRLIPVIPAHLGRIFYWQGRLTFARSEQMRILNDLLRTGELYVINVSFSSG